MKRKKPVRTDYCPICEELYKFKGGDTKHHIFYPKRLYKPSKNPRVIVCNDCHQEFNGTNNYHEEVTAIQCLIRWILFCRKYNKDAFELYPVLADLK